MDYYIILCCFLTGLGILYCGFLYVKRLWRIRNFSSTIGTISALRTELDHGTASPINNEFPMVLKISYRFQVDGKDYRGTQTGGYYEFAKDDVKNKHPLYLGKLQTGDSIDVFYDPQNPKDNYHRHGGRLWEILFALIIFFVGGFFLKVTHNLIKQL